MKNTSPAIALYSRIREILESARTNVARSVNTNQVIANWLVGREIVEEQQSGEKRATYGKRLLTDLSTRLQADYGEGFSVPNLEHFRNFYLSYTGLLGPPIPCAARRKSFLHSRNLAIPHALRRELAPVTNAAELFSESPLGQSWQPGQLHPNLSWTHYRTLLRVEKSEARAFYEIEAIDNNWAARELERQINSLLYERLALSKDKKGLMRLATKGQEIWQPADVFKDPVVKYTLGPEQSRKIFASRYKLYLPSEEELHEEIRREVRRLPPRKLARPTRKKANKP